MADRLTEYREKRDATRTPEPVPAGPLPRGKDDTFVIQQHHARSLHWDLRLERDGVLVSWAVPRGIPRDPDRNHLAVHTEDHPIEYAEFEGEIPAGEYGGGRMTIFDRGTYETEKWRDREVIVTLRGSRVDGRFVLFRTGGDKDWMIHRMDGPPPGWTPMPELAPMLATEGRRPPSDDEAWAYELEWDGTRALAEVSGGRLRLLSTEGEEITKAAPELRDLAEGLAPTECLLDGALVALDQTGRISPDGLRRRLAAAESAAVRRVAARVPVQYFVFDLLWLEGTPTLDLSYVDRRELLTDLGLAGPHWQTPPHFVGGGRDVLQAAREQGQPGIVAKRLDSQYEPGRTSKLWRRIATST